MFDQVQATRYAVPLREGGSLPAVVDTGSGRSYVVKFRGAGQGAKALIAEMLAAGIASALGLPVPAAAVVHVDGGFGSSEPDPEIQDILKGSTGPNFGLEFLSGALGFDAAADLRRVDPQLAAEILWFDAFIGNPDRTPRNTNLLLWNGGVWLIDHGASFYFHHRWEGWRDRVHKGIPRIAEHLLLPRADSLPAADQRLRPLLTPDVVHELVAALPEEWLTAEPEFPNEASHRAAYRTYMTERLSGPQHWFAEAETARWDVAGPGRRDR